MIGTRQCDIDKLIRRLRVPESLTGGFPEILAG
jgi:hypothetical protein